jgi:hypothetical protein
MSFTIDCPRCSRTLNVTEKAYGKTLPCPGCNQLLQVPHPAQASPQASRVGATPPPWAGTWQNGQAPPEPARSLPPGMPPMPPSGESLDFLSADGGGHAGPRALAKAAQGLNFADMFLGKEKESIFKLLPDEDVLGEVTIHHKHFGIVDKGVTRVTLTNRRLLYTSTRVFSPLYWLLVALFWPLILYYALRIACNRSGSLSLGSVDSVEKRYFPNWTLLILILMVGYVMIALCIVALRQIVGDSPGFLFAVTHVLAGLLAVGLLILLLATRGPWMLIVSGNNRFPISRRPGDVGGEETELDAFFQKVNIEVHRAKMLQLRASSATT